MSGCARRRATAEGTAYYPEGSGSRQKHSRAPKRRNVSQPPSRRQITLTQYERGTPFAPPAIGDSEDEFDEPRPKKRSRRSTLPPKTESQNTLTQIGWISTIPPSDSEENENGSEASDPEEPDKTTSDQDSLDGSDARGHTAGLASDEEEFNGFSDEEGIGQENVEFDGSESRQETPRVHEEMNTHKISGERPEAGSQSGSGQHQGRPGLGQQPPHTPRKVRILEVPSSQSPPVTPLSAIHTHERRRLLRSPLHPLSANPQSLLDSPSKTPRVASTSIRQSAKKAVTFKDQLPSSTNKRRLHSPASSEIADSEDDYNTEDDDNEDVANAVAGIDIGQETQAYIRRIDFNCASALPTAEPDPEKESTQDDDGSPPPDSSANRSFNFDEEAQQRLQTQAEQPSPAPAMSQVAPPSPIHASPSSPIPVIKPEPETQQQPQLQLWDSSTQGQHQPPPLSCPIPPSQATTTDSPTQTSPHPFIKPDPAEAPPSSQPPPSSYLPETYYSHVSADERIPSSQPTQLHLKQILLQPATQTQTQDEDEQDRVPDSQRVERREVENVEKEVAGARVVRRVEGLVTATQMIMQQGSVGDEFSLPPPPPWSQTQETQEAEDEE